MAKTARKHFGGDGWHITERYFSNDFSKVAESIFSQGNEYMGSRGFLDESNSAPTLRDTYCNGVYEFSVDKGATAYKGIATRTHFMVNACNFFDLVINVDGVELDMANSEYTDYERNLNLKNGVLTRTLTWHVNGKKIKLFFERFFDMQHYHRAYQRLTILSDADADAIITANIHFEGTHWGQPSRWKNVDSSDNSLRCITDSTNQMVGIIESVTVDGNNADETIQEPLKVSKVFNISLKKGEESRFVRLISLSSHANDVEMDKLRKDNSEQCLEGFDRALERNEAYWSDFWDHSDIVIDGDELNQQGIRFCIFQLQQTYHGISANDNIGAKGLTGEAYSGHTFWDTETYYLPYYLYNNPTASRYLLEYRYSTLNEARKRASDLDCKGACYPIATLNGEEACTLWQHASLQMQPSTGVAYGIYHYSVLYNDKDFLYSHGIEMLIEISRYLATRGQWDQKGEYFGYYAVMGPDEFQMMVNHNTYTNYMAKKTLPYTLDVLDEMPEDQRSIIVERLGLTIQELSDWQRMADHMKILYDPETLLYEQHEGFYSLPHIDVDSIPDEEFPLYSHWSYDRIYRNDMIKQPDVLMFQLLYSEDFSAEVKRKNYEYYEPRCIHESSLSPSVHSIIACEIGKKDDAVKFFEFASRLDLDDYNRNTEEGLHTTSIAAAWLNIVYGFGGLRDGKGGVSLSPMIPDEWNRYSFKVRIGNSNVKINVDKQFVVITTDGKVTIKVYDNTYEIDGTLTVKLGK